MDNKLIELDSHKTFSAGSLPKPPQYNDNNGNGGGIMKKDKYVTHEELNHAIDKLDAKIDLSTEKLLHHMDNRFNETDIKIHGLKGDLKSTNTKLAFIFGILTPVLTAIILKFFHLN